jgi:bacillithiol synthase
MNVQQLPLSEIGFYSKLMLDYTEGHPDLVPFYQYIPHLDSFPDVIENRNQFPFHRLELVDELTVQNAAYFEKYPAVKANINSLRDAKTYTVTTGHQLCIAGGPSYFIYKIISTIKLSLELKAKYPDYNFVPVYWMASEDHDIEEINHVHCFGQKLVWETKERGASGRLKTDSAKPFIEALSGLFSNEPHGNEITALLNEAYVNHSTLAEATRSFVLSLFGQYGLVVIDADSAPLKKLFSFIIRDELDEQASSSIVEKTSTRLEKNYKIQVNPREINLFYLDDQLRERIVSDVDHTYSVLRTDLTFNRDFLLDLVEKQVERFSPNVVLRPLYQEKILPNLAYIGGPGELAYWLQLKDLFEHYSVNYPVLVPRNNAVVIPNKALDKFTRLGFSQKDLFRNFDPLVREWLASQEEIAPGIEDAKQKLTNIYTDLEKLFSGADPTLISSVQAEMQKVSNGLDNLGKKGNAALKRKHEVALSQIQSALDKVNPSQMPQERFENFLTYYAKHGQELLSLLVNQFELFNYKMTIVIE